MRSKINKAMLASSFLMLGAVGVNAQTVNKFGNNPMTITSNAVLELESTTKGLLAPRMTNANRNTMVTTTAPGATALGTADAGLLIYQTDANAGVAAADATAAPAEPIGFYQWSGTRWVNQNSGTSVAAAAIRVGVAYTPATGSPYVASQEMTLSGDAVAIDAVAKTVIISSNNATVNTYATSQTLTSANNAVYISGTVTLTLPAVADNKGRTFLINKTDSSTLTFSPAISNVDGSTFSTLNYAKTFRLQSNGTNWYLLN